MLRPGVSASRPAAWTGHFPHIPSFPGVDGPVLLVVMDGIGLGHQDSGDAVHLARTPNLDRLSQRGLTTRLRAHGKAVGLPSDDDMGNSEVGHNALGAGRIFDQGAKRVALAIESGEIFEGPEWKRLTNRVRSSAEPIHFIGLLCRTAMSTVTSIICSRCFADVRRKRFPKRGCTCS